jgi:DNA primase
MEQRRNKYWRRQQQWRVFKARVKYYAASYESHTSRNEDGTVSAPLHWHEMAKEKWCQVYKTTGTPCSCWMCRGYSYDRKEFKKDTGRIIRESFD